MHGVGMRFAVWAIPLDRSGLVRSVRLLEPNRVVVDPGATWFLELPQERAPPPPGSRLEARGPVLP